MDNLAFRDSVHEFLISRGWIPEHKIHVPWIYNKVKLEEYSMNEALYHELRVQWFVKEGNLIEFQEHMSREYDRQEG